MIVYACGCVCVHVVFSSSRQMLKYSINMVVTLLKITDKLQKDE